jgi:HEAT repeat protein
MHQDYLSGIENGSHWLSPLLRFLEERGTTNPAALRISAPDQLAFQLQVPFASPNPIKFVELLVKSFPTMPPVEDARFAQFEFDNSCTMFRKYAAYALGQLGYESSIVVLDRLAKSDPAPAVRNAAGAALIAIKQAPADRGFGEEERLALIEQTYSDAS